MEEQVGHDKDMSRAAQPCKLKCRAHVTQPGLGTDYDVFETLPKMIPFPNVKMLGLVCFQHSHTLCFPFINLLNLDSILFLNLQLCAFPVTCGFSLVP